MNTPEQMKAQQQDWQRRLEQVRSGGRHGEYAAGGAYSDTAAEFIERLDSAIRSLDFMIRPAAAGRRPGESWRPEHFRPGDHALILGCWYLVVRVDRGSLTVPPLVLLGRRRLDPQGSHEWTDIVSYDAVYGRRRGGHGVRHPLLAAEGICTELAGTTTTDTQPLRATDAGGPCGRTPVARLTIRHDGTFCGCDWLCRLDRYVDRWLQPWTEQRELCHPHLAENQQRDPALHQPPGRVLQYLPPPGTGEPARGEQRGARFGEIPRAAEPRVQGDWP